MKKLKLCLNVVVIAILACVSAQADWFTIGASADLSGGDYGLTNDLFEGAAITANSPLNSGGGPIENAFAPNIPNFWDRVIFTDSPAGTTEYIEFNTTSSIYSVEFRFLFEPDGNSGGNNLRNTTAVRLYARTTPGPFVAGDKILDIAGWSQDAESITGNGSAKYTVRVGLDTPVTSQYFRVEFDEGWTAGLAFNEIDALPVPEPVTFLLGGALLGLAFLRRN